MQRSIFTSYKYAHQELHKFGKTIPKKFLDIEEELEHTTFELSKPRQGATFHHDLNPINSK